ncbi:hypothetical protein [Myroides sp. LJL119]
MKYLQILLTSLLVISLSGCTGELSKDELQDIAGYWEISKAKLPDGTTRDFSINASIDFFQIDSSGNGLRYKVMPQFNGEYLTNDVPEQFHISFQDKVNWINYSTEFSSWKEELVKLNEKELVVKNQNDIIYIYKRPVPFTLK